MRGISIFATISLMCTAMPTTAQNARNLVPSARTEIKPDFAFPSNEPVRILLFRPDIEVTEETVGGLDQPKADWTQKARIALLDALTEDQRRRTHEFVQMDQLQNVQAADAEEYRSLFKLIINAAIEHKFYPGNKLPSKAARFDWTLGTGANKLGGDGIYNYGLFLRSYDSFPSASRSRASVIGSLMGEGEVRGKHYGYAALVDLTTGDMVWINVNLRMLSDTRTPDGAGKRITELLSGFPSRMSKIPMGKSK